MLVLHLHVAPDDVGKVIGRGAGSHARSAPSSVRAGCARTAGVLLEIAG